MKSKVLCVISLWLSGYFLISCTAVKPEAPKESYPLMPSMPKSSFISLPVEIEVSELEQYINRQLSGLIYEDDSYDDNGGDNLMVKAWKLEPIRIELNDNVLSYNVPLKLWIKAGWKISKFGLEVSDYREAEGSIRLRYKTAVSLNPDWSLSTSTSSDGYEWISKPVVKMGPVDVPVKMLADVILKAKSRTINTAIDKAISSGFDLKKNMDEIWSLLHQPIEVNEAYQVWIRLNPRQIYSTPLKGKAGKISYAVAMESTAEAFIGKKPDVQAKSILPPLKIQDRIDNQFIINLKSDLSFEKVNEMARQYLHGQKFSHGKYSITVGGVSLYGSEGKMAVGLDVTGSIKGKIYLTGMPYYDSADRSIKVRDLDFDLKTRNALLKTGSWLFQGVINRAIAGNLVFPVGVQLDTLKALCEEGLNDYELAKGVGLAGHLGELQIGGIELTRDNISASLVIRGRLGLKFK